MTAGLVAEWPFKGRDAEVDLAARLLDATPPGIVLITGEAGVGKTRLARAVRRRLTGRGRAVEHVIASGAEANVPLGPFAGMLPATDRTHDSIRSSVHHAATMLFEEFGDTTPVISIDDAHDLDRASTLLVTHLAGTGQAAVLLTVRSDRTVPPELAALATTEGGHEIRLRPLDRATTLATANDALEGELAHAAAEAIWEASGGSPLLLRELLYESMAAGSLRQVDGLWHLAADQLPERVVDLVGARLDELDEGGRDALDLIAIGIEVGYEIMAGLVGHTALTALERSGLIEAHTDGRRRNLSVAHPIHAEIVRGQMSTARSIDVHARLADALEATGGRRRVDTFRIALARLDGGGNLPIERMLDGATHALRHHDPALAERLARAAFEAGGDVRANRILAGALMLLGRQAESETLFRAADTTGLSDQERALFAAEWADTVFWGLGRFDEAKRIVEAAGAEIDDPEWRDHLTGTGAAYDLTAGYPAESLKAVDRIRSSGEGKPAVNAALIAAPALAMLGRGEEAVAAADAGLIGRQALDDEEGLAYDGMLFMARTLGEMEVGRITEAAEAAEIGHTMATQADIVYGTAWFGLMCGRARLMGGRLAEAEHWLKEAAAGFAEIGLSGNRRWCVLGTAWAAALRGHVEDARRWQSEADTVDAGHTALMEPEMYRCRAAVAAAGGEPDEATRLIRKGVEFALERDMSGLAHGALHDLVRLDVAPLPVAELIEIGAVVEGPLAAARTSHGCALADRDGDALIRAADDFDTLDARLFAAEALAQAAAALRRDGQAQRSRQVGAEAVRRAGACDGAATPALLQVGPVAELTRREREVARLAAGGLSSKQVAERLGVSRRTVDNHLHRAYTKLQITSREELADLIDRPAP